MKRLLLLLCSVSFLLVPVLGVSKSSDLEKFARALDRITGVTEKKQQEKHYDVLPGLPHFRWADMSCWFNSGVQLVYNMPEYVDLLLANKKELVRAPFWKNVITLFEKIRSNKNPDYDFATELLSVHTEACKLLKCNYGDQRCAASIAQRLIGKSPDAWPEENDNAVLAQVKNLVVDFGWGRENISNVTDGGKRVAYNLKQLRVSIPKTVEYVGFMHGGTFGSSPYVVPTHLIIDFADWSLDTELVGIIVNRPGHFWALIKNQYEKNPRWYFADDNSRKYSLVPDAENYVAQWPHESNNVYYALYKKRA